MWKLLMNFIIPKKPKQIEEIKSIPFTCAGCGGETRQSVINDYQLTICSDKCLDVVEMQCAE